MNLRALVSLTVYSDKAVFFSFNFKYVQYNESSQSLILSEVEKASISFPLLWIKRQTRRLSTAWKWYPPWTVYRNVWFKFLAIFVVLPHPIFKVLVKSYWMRSLQDIFFLFIGIPNTWNRWMNEWERWLTQLAKGTVVVRVSCSDSLSCIFLLHLDLLVFC